MVRMVALDIDGTLLPPGADVLALPDDDVKAAIQALQENNIVVVLATGRMYPGTHYIAQHLGIEQPLICQQGASVHEADGRLRYGHAIEAEIAADLMRYADMHNWPLAWFDHERYLVTADTPQSRFFAAVSQVPVEIHSAPQHSGIRATGIDIISNEADARDVHVFLEARYGARITLLDFNSVTAVHAPQSSKGAAIAAMAANLGIANSEVLAIGDGVNDVSMLAWAGHSATPSHGDRHACEAAKEVLAAPGIAGVAEKLRSLL